MLWVIKRLRQRDTGNGSKDGSGARNGEETEIEVIEVRLKQLEEQAGLRND